MRPEDLPVKRYTLTHLQDHGAPIRACVHFITYGVSYGPANVTGVPCLLDLDLTKHWPPPEDLCKIYTGQHPELAHSFFSNRANHDEYRKALRFIWEQVNFKPVGRCVACMIHCNIGKHRSVAMAERLAKKVGNWNGFEAECLHLDLGKERSEGEPARGRIRSRNEAQPKSEIEVTEVRRKRTTTTDVVPPPREAPSRVEKVSWLPTGPVREPYPRRDVRRLAA